MAKSSKPPQPVSAFALLPKSYGLVRANLNIFIALYSVSGLFALWSFLNWFTDNKQTWSDEQFDPSSWVGAVSGLHVSTPAGVGVGFAFLLAVILVIFSLMGVILTLRVAQHGKIELPAVWNEFKRKGLKLLALEIVMGILVILGFFAFIVPGIILLWRFFLAPYILLDKNTGLDEALRRSWRMTKGNFFPIFAVILVSFLFGLTGLIPYIGIIISFLLAVAYSCAPALRYQELK